MAKRKTGSKVKPKKIESLSMDDPDFDEKFAELEEEYRLMRLQQAYEDSLKPRRGMARGGVPKKKMMRGGMTKKAAMMRGGMANGKKHNYFAGGSVVDNLTPAQKNMVKKMAAANKKK